MGKIKDFLKAAGEGVLGAVSSYGQQISAYENEYDYWSDEDLVREYGVMENRFNRAAYGSAAKMEYLARGSAIKNVLNSRGYDL